ncbi:hypothetical protein [uncultured Roseibium sp.]|uniref:hypothetical protein n=1 Tax=uncultured Roseibium sp. TaxID=1936171 RepID=UPI00262A6181|nr:hypothetical protein [uncultured Roseibium sp.]
MTFERMPDPTHARARKVVDEATRDLTNIALDHQKHKRFAAEADVRAMINVIENCAAVRLKDRT